ncbi:transposase [Streptomyces sp. NK08204]|uniref:transposase n=1 Tax=Streptomyces sp. NK08204 TaxID=2873260 RepID=UPI001CED44CF|nr:transposase [Streptomyces sp. NK08204]
MKLWSETWAEFVSFLSFDGEIRKAFAPRGHFPDEAAALKYVDMALMSTGPTGKGCKRWTML